MKKDKLDSPRKKSGKSKAAKLLRELTENQISNKTHSIQNKINTIAQINNALSKAITNQEIGLEDFAEDKHIIYFRYYFLQKVQKTQVIKYLRLVMLNETITQRYIDLNIPLYIARILERDQPKVRNQPNSQVRSEQESLQALTFINSWICKFPQNLPKFLIYSLVSYAQLSAMPAGLQERRREFFIPVNLKIYAIETILNLASHHIELCCVSGGFSLLSNSVLDPILSEKSQQIVRTLLYFLNEEKNRQKLLRYIDLRKVFYVFTDLDYAIMQQNNRLNGSIQSRARFQNQLTLARNAIMTMLKSWTGLIYLGNDLTTLKALFQTLKQIPKYLQSQVRKVIFSMIEEILNLGDSFIDNSHLFQQNTFYAANLGNCYLMSLIQLLIQAGLFKILIQLSSIEGSSVAEDSQKLLKKFTTLTFNFFPQSSSKIDFLINSASSNDAASLILKSSASYIICKIGNYMYDKNLEASSKLLTAIEYSFSQQTSSKSSLSSIKQTLNFINHKQKNNYRKSLLELNMIPKQFKEQFTKWRWEDIQEFLSFPDQQKMTHKPDSNQQYRQSKLFSYLIRFYKPDKQKFNQQQWTFQTFHYARVGRLLLQNIITIQDYLPLFRKPPESQFQCTISFVAQLQKNLQKVLQEMATRENGAFTELYIPFYLTYERELVIWIALFSLTKLGYQYLLCQNNFFQILYKFITYPSCAMVIATIMFHLNFNRDNMYKKYRKASDSFPSNIIHQTSDENRSVDSSQQQSNSNTAKNTILDVPITQSRKTLIGPMALLQKSILYGSKNLIILSIEFIKYLFKTELKNFEHEGTKLLITIIMKSQDIQVLDISLKTLEEVLKKKNVIKEAVIILEKIIIKNAKKLHSEQSQSQYSQSHLDQKYVIEILKKKLSNNVLIKLLSVKEGYIFLQKYFDSWLKQKYKLWIQAQCVQYCFKLESLLDQTLSYTHEDYQAQSTRSIGYNIKEKKFHQLLFLYKLPWILHFNNIQSALCVRYQKNKFILHTGALLSVKAQVILQGTNDKQIYDIDIENQGRNIKKINNELFVPGVSITDRRVQIGLGIGGMFVDEKLEKTSNKMVFTILLDAKQPEQIYPNVYLYHTQKHGIHIYYTISNEQQQEQSTIQQGENIIFEIKRVQIQILLSSSSQNQELPLHLIQQLAKTPEGFQFLRTMKFIQYNKEKLEDKHIKPLKLRAYLWSIGYFGSTQQGIKPIIASGLLQQIIKMSFNNPVLSLRGTCRYVLSMLCHSQEGRNWLAQQGSYRINKKYLTCYPADGLSFYKIENLNKKNKNNRKSSQFFTLNFLKDSIIVPHFSSDTQYWQKFKLLPMNQQQTKVFNSLSSLVNQTNYKTVKGEINEITAENSKVLQSRNLFQNVILLLSFYKYKFEGRKAVINFFEDLIKSPEFNINGKLNFPILLKKS